MRTTVPTDPNGKKPPKEQETYGESQEREQAAETAQRAGRREQEDSLEEIETREPSHQIL